MDINRDIQQHFKKYVKYVTPNCITFYDVKDYNDYMKKYKIIDIDNSIHSKK